MCFQQIRLDATLCPGQANALAQQNQKAFVAEGNQQVVGLAKSMKKVYKKIYIRTHAKKASFFAKYSETFARPR